MPPRRSRPRARPQPHAVEDTEGSLNLRLERYWWERLWPSMMLAIGIHFVIFAWSPPLSVDLPDDTPAVLKVVETTIEVEIPPPPEAIARPAVPTLGSYTISDAVTITETTFEAFDPTERIPPPPAAETGRDGGRAAGPRFIPHEVAPELSNRAEMLRLLESVYPRALRQAGIGGTVLVWVYVDREGVARDQRVHTPSEYDALNAAALEVASHMRFSPALNRDQPVAVWVAFPINFTVGSRRD